MSSAIEKGKSIYHFQSLLGKDSPLAKNPQKPTENQAQPKTGFDRYLSQADPKKRLDQITK
ncbi:MAG: hypothetical protein KDK66_06265 [Deltaproteobacteria bacterium]|nr:hypothetical protein [Deltaproteobacteria bacterium]